MKNLLALALTAMIAIGGVAYADGDHASHGAAAAADSEATKAFKAANMKMHEGMEVAFTGDVDVDFVKGMIPHHQGAIDMAEVQLKYGRDAQTRKWAEEIISAQKREIAEMQAWLKTKGQ